MITRIFRGTIREDLHEEFERKFVEISVPLVKSHSGFISLSIGRPTKWNRDEYLMISVWEDIDAIKGLAGEHWNEALIPEGMEKYISSCTVDHYENIDV